MHSETASPQIHSNNFGFKQLFTIIKTFHYYGTRV